MKVSVTWLPVGHIMHAYRRVFVVHKDETLWHVVNIMPMTYEAVFNTQQIAGADKVKDPSLLWGLSCLVKLLNDEEKSFEKDDDGYLQIRPGQLTQDDLLSIEEYQKAVSTGEFVLNLE
jgi:hypothetical protein